MGELENNKKIFEYIRPNDNDQLSMINSLDLQELLYYINCYYLELRDVLGLGSNDTFGLEIECEEADEDTIIDMIHNKFNLYSWTIDDDCSLIRGKEIISPILRDNVGTWKELTNICKVLNEHAVIGSKSSGHIHVGAQILGNSVKVWLNFIKIWSTYENVIFRFLYGEFLNARPCLKKYASPCAKSLLIYYDDLKNISRKSISNLLEVLSYTRDRAVNFKRIEGGIFNINNTIEFRCPNGTLEPIIWQNNVNLLVKLLNYCKSNRFNDDIINRRQSLIKIGDMRLEGYHEIYLQQAIEFCDLIFDNNLDKIYFLRQYLKSFEVSTCGVGREEAKCFVKSIYH